MHAVRQGGNNADRRAGLGEVQPQDQRAQDEVGAECTVQDAVVPEILHLVGHSAGRMAREALFFLVWSCPQPVMQANLCELAGLE